MRKVTVLPWYRRFGQWLAGPTAKSGNELVLTDGWENATTGLGTYARDKSTHADFARCEPISLDWEKLEAIYHDDDLSGRIVDIFPNHMFRKGWEIHVEGDTPKAKPTEGKDEEGNDGDVTDKPEVEPTTDAFEQKKPEDKPAPAEPSNEPAPGAPAPTDKPAPAKPGASAPVAGAPAAPLPPPGKDPSKTKSRAFVSYAKRLCLNANLKEAVRWSRLFGGALLLLGIDDNRPLDQPVDEANIRTIAYVSVIERQYAMPNTYYTDPLSPKFGQPETYLVTNTLAMSPGSVATAAKTGLVYEVHESRVVRFDGAPTSKLEKQRLGGWTHSVLQRPLEKLKAFVQVFQASSNLMTDASQGIYKLEGLMSQIGSNEKSTLETRMLMLDMGRSVARSILLDKDGEEFERTVAAISGYPDMLDRFMMLLSSATEIPVTILMGRSAAGQNSTGDSDFRQFYDVIEDKQTGDLEPRLQIVYRYIALAKDGPTSGTEVDIEIKFRSLWTPTLVEHSQINFTQSQADLNYVTMGAVTGEEIAVSRFTEDGEINLSTKIDIQGRRDAQTAAKSFDPYTEAEHEDVSGEMDIKRQGKRPEMTTQQFGPDGKPLKPLGPDGQPMKAGDVPSNGRPGKVTKPNSSMPGDKSGSGR